MATVFESIYNKNHWVTGSGPGSDPARTVEYRAFLERFIEANSIRSIVDIGCGDWQSSRFINFDRIIYHGFDLVPSLIEMNNKRFAAANIKFDLMPPDKASLPRSDLLLMKDVLQHLPDADIHDYVRSLRSKHRFLLLTNSYAKIDTDRNQDIQSGDFRCLDLSSEPYFISGAYVFQHWGFWEQIRTFLVIGDA
jgi:SAM-dependent methyltransferase